MNKLFMRRLISSLRGYHAPDFTSGEFDCFGADTLLRNAPVRALQDEPGGPPKEWLACGLLEFEADLMAAEQFLRKNGVLSYDLILAPPKSFSIAALAAPKLDPIFVQIHQSAVDGVMAALCPLCGVPKNISSGSKWQLARTKLWRFRHAFDLNLGPHLHDHVCIFNRAFDPVGCLDGTIFFDHLWDLDLVYHYGLRAGLAKAGVLIEFEEDAPYWAWRLPVDPVLERMWASTTVAEESDTPNYIASVAARNKKPKLLGVPLSWARKGWLKKLKAAGLDISWNRHIHLSKEPPERSLKQLFLHSGILSRLQLFSAYLRPLLGSPISLEDRQKEFDHLLHEAVHKGEVLSFEDRVYCHPEGYQSGRALLKAVHSGRGKGHEFRVLADHEDSLFAGFPSVIRAAARPDTLKFVRRPRKDWLTPQGSVVSADDLRASTGGHIISGFGLGVTDIASRIRAAPQTDSTLVLLSAEEHLSPFWTRILKGRSPSPVRRMAQTKWCLDQGRSLKIRKGRVDWRDKTFRGLFAEPKKGSMDCVIAPPSMCSEDFQFLQRWLFGRLMKTMPSSIVVNVDEPVDWPNCEQYHEPLWANLVVLRENPLLKRGLRWIIQGAVDGTWHLARTLRERKIIPFAELDAIADKLCIGRSREITLPQGMPCRVTQKISLPGLRLPKGALVMPEKYERANHSIICTDGLILPNGYRFLEPAILSREIPSNGCDRLICEALDKTVLRTLVKKLPKNSKIEILTTSVDECRGELQMMLTPPLRGRKSDDKEAERDRQKAHFFPEDDYWLHRILEKARQRPLSPAKKKPLKRDAVKVNPPSNEDEPIVN